MRVTYEKKPRCEVINKIFSFQNLVYLIPFGVNCVKSTLENQRRLGCDG